MPTYERYWKNPEHHRKWDRNRKKQLRALGYKGGHRNVSAYLRNVAVSNRWNKRNRDSTRNSTNKYHEKIRRSNLPGNSDQQRYLYPRIYGTLKNGHYRNSKLKPSKVLLPQGKNRSKSIQPDGNTSKANSNPRIIDNLLRRVSWEKRSNRKARVRRRKR